jgi:outer membrane receptor protein involved in Fe transport
VDGGGEWQRIEIETFPRAGQVVSGFVQDHWRATPGLTVQAGLRIESIDPALEDATRDTHLLPRFGVAWQPFDAETVVRAAYGRFVETRAALAGAPASDQWSIGAARQWGRTRTIEVAYEGARIEDISRFKALVLEIEQRSDVGLTGHLAYTYGATDYEVAGPIDLNEDPHHKLTGAFTWWLPFGDERLLFSDGLLRDIFGEMQLTGVFALENARSDPQAITRGDFKTFDLGVLKNLGIGGGTLQLRFETFNTLNRPNRRPFFYPDLLSVPATEHPGRRYQLGLRYLY